MVSDDQRSAAQQLRLAEPGQAVRASADARDRLQPHRQAPPERIGARSIWAERDPDYLNSADARFPGAPNYRLFTSTRPLYSVTLRSTLSSNLVNELRGGITALGGSSNFGDRRSSNGPQTFADIGGYAIDFDADIGRPTGTTTNGPSWRAAPTFSLDDSLTWQQGTHSLNFGGVDPERHARGRTRSRSGAGHQARASTPRTTRRSACSTRRNFPGASAGAARPTRASSTRC